MSSRERVARSGRWLDPAITSSEKKLRHLLDVAAQRGADEVALRRVWARLAQVPDLVHTPGDGQGDGRARWWPWALSASILGAAAAVMFVVLGTPRLGSVAGSRGTTPVLASQAPERPSRVESAGDAGRDRRSTVLLAPATVRTGRGELLPLALRGGTEIALAAESELTLDENDRPTVTVGEVRFHVPRQPSGQTFTVMARDYRIAVVGTRFVVRVTGPSTSVRVDEGVVEVWKATGGQRLARIRAGQSWTSPLAARAAAGEGKTAPGSRGVMTTAGARHVSRAYAMLGSGRRARVSREARESDGVVGARAPGAASPSDAAPVLAAQAIPASLPDVGSTSAPATPTVRTAAGDTAAGAPTTPVPPVAAAPALAPRAATLEIIALAIEAKTARAAGNPERALAIYRALADKGGPAGENAEYEMGRVQRDSLGQPQHAIASWRAYRARHPRGLLRIEADISIIETLVNVDDKSGALAEASEFIHRYPDGERHGEMARLVGDLSRERGDWRAAIDAYDQSLSDGRARAAYRDDVTFHRATCVLADDPHRGAEALAAYVKEFPEGRFRSRAQHLLAETASSTPSARR